VITPSTHDDVTAYRLSWWRSRAIGYSVCVYRVRDVLIDTGYPAAHREVSQLVRAAPVRGAYVTHQHEDHAGNAPWLARHGVPLAMDERTLAELRSPHRIGLYRHITWRAMRPLSTPFAPFVDPTLTLVHTPGHSPDHHAVWDEQTGTLFAGDLFLGVRVKLAHAYEQPYAHVQSLRAMIARGPARVFCAHRGLLRDGPALLAAKADWMESQIDRVERLARDGADVPRIRAEVLGPRDSTHWISAGDYSPDHWIRAVLRDLPHAR
jgi:glyoxylase-like metal-dependent hydrolase (beta-lactamase superfamily II)